MNLDNNKPIACLGLPSTGKTNSAFWIMDKIKNRKKYIFGYPKKVKEYIPLYDMQDFAQIEDCILFIDEIQRYIKLYDKRSNDQLIDLLSFCEHRNIKLIFTTQLSQFITKQVEAFISCWCIHKIDIHTLKNGSTPKRIIQNFKHPLVSDWGLSFKLGQFIWYNTQSETPGENSIYQAENMNTGKAWKKNKINKK